MGKEAAAKVLAEASEYSNPVHKRTKAWNLKPNEREFLNKLVTDPENSEVAVALKGELKSSYTYDRLPLPCTRRSLDQAVLQTGRLARRRRWGEIENSRESDVSREVQGL